MGEWIGQFGQDRWVLCDVFRAKRAGYFLDVGAYDGVTISNTLVMEKHLGWQGLCVEANPIVFEALARNRACAVECALLLDCETSVDFIEIDGEFPAVESGVSHLLSKHANGNCGTRTSSRKTATLESLLSKHSCPSVIDYLSIDTEGAEYLILKNFPFHKYKILAITIEHNNNFEQRALQRRLLALRGYWLVRTVQVDDFWIHRDAPRSLSILLRGRLAQLLMDFPGWRDRVIFRIKDTLKRILNAL